MIYNCCSKSAAQAMGPEQPETRTAPISFCKPSLPSCCLSGPPYHIHAEPGFPQNFPSSDCTGSFLWDMTLDRWLCIHLTQTSLEVCYSLRLPVESAFLPQLSQVSDLHYARRPALLLLLLPRCFSQEASCTYNPISAPASQRSELTWASSAPGRNKHSQRAYHVPGNVLNALYLIYFSNNLLGGDYFNFIIEYLPQDLSAFSWQT